MNLRHSLARPGCFQPMRVQKRAPHNFRTLGEFSGQLWSLMLASILLHQVALV